MPDQNQSIKIAQTREIKGMFEGSLLKLLLQLGLPMLAGMSVQIIYNITDIIWLSRIDMEDPSYVGGVGLIFPVLFFAMAIANGIMVGISSLTARSIGSRDYKTLNQTAESGLLIASFFSLLLLLLFLFFGAQITRLLGAEDDYYLHALEYLYYILPAGIFMFLVMVFLGLLQGEGLMKKVMLAMIIGTAGNIILDPLFIFTLRMKVKGAALATGVAQVFSLVYLLMVFLKRKTMIRIQWKIKNINWQVIRQIMVIGLPQTTGQMAMAFSIFIFNIILIDLDPFALTAMTLTGRIDQIVLLPLCAIGSALVTMVGQNFGRKNYTRIRNIWKISIFTSSVVIIVLAGIAILTAPIIFPFFSSVETVIDYAVLQVRIIEFSFLFIAIGILSRSFFQAVGKPLPALLIPLLRMLLVAVPAVLLYVFVFKIGVYGVWLGILTGNLVSCLIGWVWVNNELKKYVKD